MIYMIHIECDDDGMDGIIKDIYCFSNSDMKRLPTSTVFEHKQFATKNAEFSQQYTICYKYAY